ncbi:MAG: D-aminoacylase [Rhodospirillaceae bacterium]|nr:D-aminoacylase [Rhodospirillaceae bacterium]
MSGVKENACDFLFVGGEVIDGTGAERVRADLAVTGDRVSAIGDLSNMLAGRKIDATGRIVAPGFIDVHTHDDNLLFCEPDMTPKTSQGVTTVVVGNCGVSLAPLVLPDGPPPPPMDLLGDSGDYRYERFSDYLDSLEETPAATNAAFLVGHSTLRLNSMDDVTRPAKAGEIDAMAKIVDEAMQCGATGFSTGLIYGPNKAAPTDEIIALAQAASDGDGIYVTHMRNEADKIDEALEETFEIGRRANLPVVVSHHKCAGKMNHGRSRETLARFDRAAKSQKVGLDVYPYNAGSTVILTEMIDVAERVIITWSEARPEFAGCDLAEISTELGCSKKEAAAQLIPGGAIYFMMSEEDVQRILAYPNSMVGSDGLPHDSHPHPRLWGTFPRVLGHYARDLGLFPLEDAVRRMTGLSASEFGLKDRGVLRQGAYADITLFNPKTIIDSATFEQPMTQAEGIDLVMVNGGIIREAGQLTGARPGRALRRNN